MRHLQTVGGVAQLGERLPCTQEAIGSSPFTSTRSKVAVVAGYFFNRRCERIKKLLFDNLDGCKNTQVCGDARVFRMRVKRTFAL